jgi:hypothetical protein
MNLDGSQITTGTIADARLPLSISRTADVDARFDPSTGHNHTGTAGDGSQISHSTLTAIIGADPGSTDAQTNKHVSNAQTKQWQDHLGATSGNPHGTTAAQVGSPVSVEGVTNPGGNIDLVNSNAITIAGNNTTKQITIGETHSARTDNPHATTAGQIDTQGGTNRIAAQINAGTGIINELRIDAAIARDSEVSAKFDVTSGHDHDGVDSKKIPGLSTTYFDSLDGANLTNLNGSQITTGTVAAARIDTAIVRTSDQAVPNGIATLDSSTLVVQNPANATTTPTASKIPIADTSGKLAAGWGGNASTLATLDANSRLVQAANTIWDGTAGRSASQTPTANTIPVLNTSGQFPGSITGNADTVDNAHASDLLARANHTGTQSISTVSGHNKAAHDALGITAGNSVLFSGRGYSHAAIAFSGVLAAGTMSREVALDTAFPTFINVGVYSTTALYSQNVAWRITMRDHYSIETSYQGNTGAATYPVWPTLSAGNGKFGISIRNNNAATGTFIIYVDWLV